jgi:alpha-1,2-mannosyltransferase
MASTTAGAAERRPYEHPTASHAKKKRPSIYPIAPISAFYVFLAANMMAALFAPIQDCDETFNYWEPAHYLSHGYGLQTWEYSPDYAIRSWAYIGLHAVVGNLRRLMPQSSKVSEFYFIRYGLALACALSQTLLYMVTTSTLNGRIGVIFMLITVTSPANFNASAAFLPSSFAMYACMLGAAAFMNWRGGLRTALGIFWFAVGGVLGWPFAAALCAPFVLEEVVFIFFTDRATFEDSVVRIGRGVISGILVLVLTILTHQ